MRTETIVRNLFQFEELSDKAKEKARDWYREGLHDAYEFDHTLNDAKEMAQFLGIEIEEVIWSGFSSQGDGARFIGSYKYAENALKDIFENAPKDIVLHKIALEMEQIQLRNDFSLSAKVTGNDRYANSGNAEFDVWENDDDYPTDEAENEIKEVLKDFMNWIYKQLDLQNDFINSNEAIDENIINNEYEFLESGKVA